MIGWLENNEFKKMWKESDHGLIWGNIAAFAWSEEKSENPLSE
jgi:hypothetical protein